MAAVSKVHALGMQRFLMTGRIEPDDKDFDWLADETGGEIQGTDPSDAVDFTAGMRAGAKALCEERAALKSPIERIEWDNSRWIGGAPQGLVWQAWKDEVL